MEKFIIQCQIQFSLYETRFLRYLTVNKALEILIESPDTIYLEVTL